MKIHRTDVQHTYVVTDASSHEEAAKAATSTQRDIKDNILTVIFSRENNRIFVTNRENEILKKVAVIVVDQAANNKFIVSLV